MMEDSEEQKLLVIHMCYTIFPNLEQATDQDVDTVCYLAQRINNSPTQPEGDMQTRLLTCLCDLHYTLMQESPRMRARAWHRLLPRAILLLDEAYCGESGRVFTREELERDNRDSVFLPHLHAI